MAFLLTNDDGIDAPGLAALERILVGEETLTAAPRLPHSGCGHQTTTATPITLETLGDRRYAVQGTPADCTRLGLVHLAPAQPCAIDWVISGINAGGNLGVDAYLSGTVAAVREAAFQGLPGIAISQYLGSRDPIDWKQTQAWAAQAIALLLTQPPQPGQFWNVNLPWPQGPNHQPELVFCQPSRDPLPVVYVQTGNQFQYSGRYGDRPAAPGSDVAACFGGAISITQLST
ncbi:MAG: 5'/3'-nucleotidase SurE [Synechococcales cyanobacterium RM1_1_8]|nr:5'/3'-nucleotidase SurE [Synechococcales cyanobacterium RM1_1_8]